MGFEAGDAVRTDDGVVVGPGRQLEPVARPEVDRLAAREAEDDRAPLDGDDLVVGVAVDRIAVAGAVRPGRGDEALGLEADADVGGSHALIVAKRRPPGLAVDPQGAPAAPATGSRSVD